MIESRGSTRIRLGLSCIAAGILVVATLRSGYLRVPKAPRRKILEEKMTKVEVKEQAKTEQEIVRDGWQSALHGWNNPSVPYVIAPRNANERRNLGKIGAALEGEFAFMQYPGFQTYMNLEKIVDSLSDNPERGTRAIAKHEVGHRFCPYDIVTNIILKHNIEKALRGQQIPYSEKAASHAILNLASDMCINTNLVRRGDQDLPWTYQRLSIDKKKSKLWRVYGKSMELAWDKPILPEDTKLKREEQEAAENLARLFERDFFDRDRWPELFSQYARTISPFLENEREDKSTQLSDIAGNIQETLDEQTKQEVAKRLARIGSDGLPTNSEGMKDFKDIMAGLGHGDPTQASISFYDMLSDSYDVAFAKRPFGRPRVNPFQPIKWHASRGVDQLDVDYSAQVGGRIIPSVNAYAWRTRRRERHGGFEEIVPNLDLYLDSSGSMVNPIEQISLPVLAGFVASKKANRKGALCRSTNFSGGGQCTTQDWTNNLQDVFRNLVIHYNGGTHFPVDVMLEGRNPRQVIIMTDTFVANSNDFADAVREVKSRHEGNGVTVYASHPVSDANYLRESGAEIIDGTTTDMFKRVIGKAGEVYQNAT
jgi:hypothetical protein